MVLAQARIRLWTELNKLGERVLYHDTDSIIYENSPDGYNIPLGQTLGEWEDETGGLPITKFVSTGPKCYSYAVKKDDGSLKYTTKAKGFSIHAEGEKVINYEGMKNIIQNAGSHLSIQQLDFKYNLKLNAMTTRIVDKIFKFTYEKGDICRDPESPNLWKVYPFGYKEVASKYLEKHGHNYIHNPSI